MKLHSLAAPVRVHIGDIEGPRRQRGGPWAKLALAAWALLSVLVVSSLAIAHWYSLPVPPRAKPELVRALAARATASDRGRFTVTHVLYASCRCSQRIVEHLSARRARSDVSESSLLIGSTPALTQRLTAAGYRVEALSPRELKSRYAIESAPLLIVADPNHQIRYLGGYTEHKQSLDIRDAAIIDALLAGHGTRDLPLLGCAVSRSLQKLMDPFGLKYARTGNTGDD